MALYEEDGGQDTLAAERRLYRLGAHVFITSLLDVP